MEEFLESSTYIDWHSGSIKKLAAELSFEKTDELAIAKTCFEWVRDNIKHSSDYKLNPVTAKASDALAHGTGFCFAKSHLLAALLRANEIPAGLCYQRLSLSDDGEPYSLHGLNAVKLKDYGWYRIDPRGNKPGVAAEFDPPNERLAFPGRSDKEILFPQILPKPLPAVVEMLERSETYLDAINHLPDTADILPLNHS